MPELFFDFFTVRRLEDSKVFKNSQASQSSKLDLALQVASNIDFLFDDNSDDSDSTTQSDVESSDNNDKDSNNFSISLKARKVSMYSFFFLFSFLFCNFFFVKEKRRKLGHHMQSARL
jgi:hypothetical protein